MIHAHFLGRAARYYPERTALASGGTPSTFRDLHDRVAGIAAALSRHGFGVGDRLAILLPNEPEYIELVYACSWLGVIAVPLNARFSAMEIDRVLADASPRGLIRHSSLPVPTVQVSWQLVLRPPQLLDALQGRRCVSPRGADFPHLGLSVHVRGTGCRRLPSHNSKVQPAKLLRDGRSRARQSHRIGADDDQSADPILGTQGV